jgi:hypothetical protein
MLHSILCLTKFISEGIHVKANWPMTRLIEYKHNRNKQSTIFTEGYDPAIRVECWIDNFSPEAKFSTAEDQPADLEIIDGIPFRKHKLNIGTGHGIPDWMIDKISRVLLLSDTKIDGIGYTRNVDAKFEVQSVLEIQEDGGRSISGRAATVMVLRLQLMVCSMKTSLWCITSTRKASVTEQVQAILFK